MEMVRVCAPSLRTMYVWVGLVLFCAEVEMMVPLETEGEEKLSGMEMKLSASRTVAWGGPELAITEPAMPKE